MESILHWLHVLEVVGDQLDEAVVIQISGGGDYDIARREAVGVRVQNGFSLESLYCFFSPEDGFTERVILPEVLSEYFVDKIIRVVLVHFDLFNNDSAFAGNVCGIEDRIEDKIAENIERRRNMLIQNLDVKADAFLGG